MYERMYDAMIHSVNNLISSELMCHGIGLDLLGRSHNIVHTSISSTATTSLGVSILASTYTRCMHTTTRVVVEVCILRSRMQLTS